MTYLHLLSPEGEPFEVIEQRAGKLLADGWSFNPAPLDASVPRIDEIVASVKLEEERIDPVVPQGAIADAEALSNDAPVEVENSPATTEAGPATEGQTAGYIDVDETAAPDAFSNRRRRN